MAVVQISRIQQRRGRALAGTGFPQLASGEIGWAIDTQELYIGNGAVSEGAPYVGNTKILTEHDNILDLASTYQYKKNDAAIQTGALANVPISRTLQERLDEIVSIKSFGVNPNGLEDNTADLQRAIDQLFLNDSTKDNISSRVVLFLEPGEYRISNELRIPPYAHIVGSGIDSTIIKLTEGDTAVMRMVDGDSTPGNYVDFGSINTLTRPRFIHIEALTLKTEIDYPCLFLDDTESTTFERVKFEGVYVNGNNPSEFQAGVYIRGVSSVLRSENVQFKSCIFSSTGYGVYSDCDHNYIIFDKCKFYSLYDGLQLGGGIDGANNTQVISSYFDLIDRYGYYIKTGEGNLSLGNKYLNVGNDNNGYANASYSIIRFDSGTSHSIGDFFERNDRLKNQTSFGLTPFLPNVQTTSLVSDDNSFRKSLNETLLGPEEFLRFPVFDSCIVLINYVINKDIGGAKAIRTGQISITVNLIDETCELSDHFGYTGSGTAERIVFSASLEDFSGDSGIDTLVIKIYNPARNGLNGIISTNASNTTITGIASTAGLYAGMNLIKTAGNGEFGENVIITSVDGANQLSISATTINLLGSIYFDASNGSGTMNYTYKTMTA